jgi:hypothetical protein
VGAGLALELAGRGVRDGRGSGRPLLLYRGTCWKCRLLSRLVVLLSLNAIERSPLESARAARATASYPEARGKLLLMTPYGPIVGGRVIPGVMWCVLRTGFVARACD